MQTVDEIKLKYDIYAIAELAGIELKRASNNLFYSPFRDDRKPSFSIYDNGRKFKDFASNEIGDSITFYALAKNIDNKQAIKELTGNTNNFSSIVKNRIVKKPLESLTSPKHILDIPYLKWDTKQANILSNQRGFNVDALEIAYKAGVFGFCEYKGYPSWIITDSTKQNAQARRLDGKPYFGELKAMTLKNSDCSYPLGLSTIANKKLICITEGSTDFLALYHFAYVFDELENISPLCMLGATHNIGTQYSKSFSNRNVLIFADADQAGEKALNNWGQALSLYANSVRYFDYAGGIMHTGESVKDLCEFMQLDYDYWESIRPYDNPFIDALNNIKNN